MERVNGNVSHTDDPLAILPEHMREGMDAYIHYGRPTGSFLQCVLSNDFMGACREVDTINFATLTNYAIFLYNHAPAACYGSAENYQRWIQFQGLIGEEREVHHA